MAYPPTPSATSHSRDEASSRFPQTCRPNRISLTPESCPPTDPTATGIHTGVGPRHYTRRAGESGGMADAPDLGSGARKGVGVRLPPLARLLTCESSVLVADRVEPSAQSGAQVVPSASQTRATASSLRAAA